jgi:tellurite resistance protein
MASPRMNDPTWVAGLVRARANVKSEFVAIHVVAPLRDDEGVAPVVLQTRDGFWRPPVHMEAAFELCLRHLHRMHIPGPNQGKMTPQALLANRAMEALKLPGRYVPTVEGEVIDMSPAGAADTREQDPEDETAMMADHSEAVGTVHGQAERLGEVECTAMADMPEGESVELAAQSTDHEDEQCIRGVGTQLDAAVAVDASDGEPEPEETPISKQVNKASVAELGPFQQSAPSKKARRRAAQKAHRRAR